MPRRRTQLRATTAHRYEWMIDNYISPRIGDIHLRGLRVEHLDRLYHDLLTRGSRTGGELSSKTVYDVHVIMRSSLADAVRRSLAGSKVALLAHAPRSGTRTLRPGDLDRGPAAPIPGQRSRSTALPGAPRRRDHRHAPR